ncbi:17794_t:CDS:1, partial [Gigaspora margarita]
KIDDSYSFFNAKGDRSFGKVKYNHVQAANLRSSSSSKTLSLHVFLGDN